ncbi:hypothetical protein [Embleya hyalina]|uniref:hypothetical protein n=1 Tax=Embleya hyalina TaxID=516124 RepID=UPI000F843ECD|nr:hypothetical protein [Embleya hyalina]
MADRSHETAEEAHSPTAAERSDASVASPADAPPSSRSLEPSSGASSGDTTLTKAGTRLKLGESAVVEVTSGTKKGLVRIKPITIEKGSIQDLVQSGFTLKEEQKSAVPYYVRVSYTNVSDSDLSYTGPEAALQAVDDHKQRTSPAILFGKLEKCPTSTFAAFTKNVAHEDCRTFLLPASTSLDAIAYPMPDFKSAPIEWRR